MHKFNRVLIKVSGGALTSDSTKIFEKKSLEGITDNIINAINEGIEVAIVVGGGNIFRGRTADEWKIERAEADNIGMLATIMNSMILKAVISSKTDTDVRSMISIPMNVIAEQYIRMKAIKYLEEKSILILGGGTGQPFVTTDYASVQRALEIKADVVLMAKCGVNGVYDDDPKHNLQARRFKTINTMEAIHKNLQVVDQSAFVLAKDFNIPLYIFDFNEENSIASICNGTNIGTFISTDCKTEFY